MTARQPAFPGMPVAACRWCSTSAWCEYHAGDPSMARYSDPAEWDDRQRALDAEREREEAHRRDMQSLSFGAPR